MKKYIVELTAEEREKLQKLISAGQSSARKLTHARILLKADCSPLGPNWTDGQISQSLDVDITTVERLRNRFVEEGLEMALTRHKTRRIYDRKMDGANEAHLIALACGEAPTGYQRWTLQLLADRMVELKHMESLSYETVRRTLKKTNLSLI